MKDTKHPLSGISLPDVFLPETLAAMLNVSPAWIVEALEREELPGRRVGGEWLMSRTGVMASLSVKALMPEPSDDR